MISQTICEINLDNLQDIEEILIKANVIKYSMPYSIRNGISKYDVYDIDILDSLIDKLRKEPCLYVSPREIMLKAFPEKCLCEKTQINCKFCREKIKDLPLLVLDCRTESEQNSGIIPNSALLNPISYTDTHIMLDVPDIFIEMRGIFHICLLGSKTFKSSGFEFNLDSSHYQGDIVQNMLENILQAFLVKGFPYISVIAGGYEACHKISQLHNLNLENHDESHCLGCNPEGPKMMQKFKNRFKGIFGKSKKNTNLNRSLERENLETQLEHPESILRIDPTTAFYVGKRYFKDTGTESEEDYFLFLKDKFLLIGMIRGLNLKSSSRILYMFQILDLVKITSRKRELKVLTFHFSGHKKRQCFSLKTESEAKSFVKKITEQFHALNSIFNAPYETL